MSNKGKKYIKLKGDEQADPESIRKAADFMDWFARNRDMLENYARHKTMIDEDVFTDTFLRIYHSIAYKKLIPSDYKAYFLQSYRSNYITAIKKEQLCYQEDLCRLDYLTAPTFECEKYEELVNKLNQEILDFIRVTYDDVSISLFEIYIGLLPNISYKKMADILGIPLNKIWPILGNVKKDIIEKFKDRVDFIRSEIDF